MQLFSVFKKEFVKNVLTLITGSALSQIILYIAIPVLTRLFSEELFGIYMLFSSITILLKPLLSLKYELAIILPKREKDAINLFVFTLLILLALSGLLYLIIFFFDDEILHFFNVERLAVFIYWIPLSVFFVGIISAFDYWNNRNNAFKNISKGLITKSATTSTSQIATGFSSFSSLGLIPGMIFGQFCQLLMLIGVSLKSISQNTKYVSLKRMIFLAKKYKDIPVFNTLINFTNTLSNELPILLISRYFGLANVGVYGLAIKVGRAPVGIIQQSVSQVFYNKASKTYNLKEDLNQIVKKTYQSLLKIGFLVFTPLFIISFYLDFIFGENWIDVGLYVRILIPWLFVAFLSAPLTSLTLVLNKQKAMLFYDTFLLIFRFLAMFIGYYFYNDIVISLILFSGIGAIFNFFMLLYLLKISKNKNTVYQ